MKTTKRQFDLYKSECLKLIKKWGVYGWRIDFVLDKDVNARAQLSWDLESRTMAFRFPQDWDDELQLTDELIIESARHETIHALTARLCELARKRFTTDDEVYESNEELARFIENAIKSGF